MALHALEGITLLLALVAIVFATVQFLDSRRQERKIEVIVKSMSTRFVGLFPKNIGDITDLVGRADRRLRIMVDFVGYGYYSRPTEFEALFAILLKKWASGVNLQMLVYAPSLALTTVASQFREADFPKEKVSVRFERFFRGTFPGILTPTDYRPFLETIIELQHSYAIRLTQAGVQIREITDPVMFFLWLEDDEDAVFAFQNTGGDERGFTFRTRDGRLIETFTDVFERRWNSATPINGLMAATHGGTAT